MATNGINGNGKKREQTAARIIQAIRASDGLLTDAAKASGIGYRTICRYVAEYPTVKEAAQESKETLLDLAESELFKKIKTGDNTMIIFYLKTQGKARGYIERSEISNAEGENIRVEHHISDEQLEQIINSGRSRGVAKEKAGPQ